MPTHSKVRHHTTSCDTSVSYSVHIQLSSALEKPHSFHNRCRCITESAADECVALRLQLSVSEVAFWTSTSFHANRMQPPQLSPEPAPMLPPPPSSPYRQQSSSRPPADHSTAHYPFYYIPQVAYCCAFEPQPPRLGAFCRASSQVLPILHPKDRLLGWQFTVAILNT